eukprot:8472020-Alexandrium_andersonii.AAC.1
MYHVVHCKFQPQQPQATHSTHLRPLLLNRCVASYDSVASTRSAVLSFIRLDLGSHGRASAAPHLPPPPRIHPERFGYPLLRPRLMVVAVHKERFAWLGPSEALVQRVFELDLGRQLVADGDVFAVDADHDQFVKDCN